MKNILITLLIAISLIQCESSSQETAIDSNPSVKTYPREILFGVRTTQPEELKYFEDGIIPWVEVKDPNPFLKDLVNGDEIILRVKKAVIRIDYPLSTPIEIEIERENGFSRKDLILLISREYNRIYAEEEESTQIKTIPIEEREGLINRNQTTGKYGIWGHDLEDLDLSAILVNWENPTRPILELIIES